MGKHLVDGMPLNPVVGDVYFDTMTGTIKVPGENTVHTFGGGMAGSWQPKWYGYVNGATSAVIILPQKIGGTGTISVRVVRTGVYRITCSGFTADEAVPLAIGGAINSSTVEFSALPAYFTVLRNGNYLEVQRTGASGAFENGFFWLLIL